MIIDKTKYQDALNRSGLSQAAVLRQAGLSSWMNGQIKHEKSVRNDTVAKIANVLNVTVKDITKEELIAE